MSPAASRPAAPPLAWAAGGVGAPGSVPRSARGTWKGASSTLSGHARQVTAGSDVLRAAISGTRPWRWSPTPPPTHWVGEKGIDARATTCAPIV